MNTSKHRLRVTLVLICILLLSGCALPVSPVTTTPTVLNPDPTTATPPQDGNASIASKTPTVTIEPGDNTNSGVGVTKPVSITITPTLPNFDSIINFGGGGGAGGCEHPASPNTVVLTNAMTPGNIRLCFTIQGLDFDKPYRLELTGPDGLTRRSPTLLLNPYSKEIHWDGYKTSFGSVDWTSNGIFFIDMSLWWPDDRPSGSWKWTLNGSGFRAEGTLMLADRGSRPHIFAFDAATRNELMPSQLLLPNEKGYLSVVGMNYPSQALVYVLLYQERSSTSGDYEYELIQKQAVMADASGRITAELTGPFEAGRSYVVYGLTDPHIRVDGGVQYACPQNVSCDFFGIISSRSVHNAIASQIYIKYSALGGESSFLGKPNGDEQSTADRQGRFRNFQGGSIYWTRDIGAFEVHGPIRDKWNQLGSERSFLGYPATDVLTTPDGIGRFTHFQGGSIYWTPKTGAFEIHGEIRDKWASLGWETGFLGYPATDVLTTPDGIGRFTHFQGGSIYWTPNTGAWEVHGSIRDKWASLGWETGCLGYPISDEEASTGAWARQTRFQHGIIQWSSNQGAVATCY